MSLKNKTVIVSDWLFLNSYKPGGTPHWGTTDSVFLAVGYVEAARIARRLPPECLRAGVYLVTNYGLTDEYWVKVEVGGSLEPCDALPMPAREYI